MTDTPEVDLSVVIPCYRSSATLPELVAQLHAELRARPHDYEVILVVDGSPDDTYAVARSLELEDPDHVRAVLLRRNYGQHNALLAGIMRVKHEVVVTMDDDLQHRPDQVAALVAPLEDPLVDLVYGNALQEEHGRLRSISSRAVKSGLGLTGVPNAQRVSAFRAFRTELRDGFAHVVDAFFSLDVVLSWTTTSVVAVPVVMDRRASGRSSYTVASLLRHAWNMVTGYSTLPLRLVTWLGFVCCLIGTVVLVNVLVLYALGRIEVAGFTTLVALLTSFSGAMMLSVGILGEYLGRLHFRSMERPTYLVRVDSQHDAPTAGVPRLAPTTTEPEPGPDEVADAIVGHWLEASVRDQPEGRS